MNFPNDLERDSSGKVITAIDWLGNRLRIGDRVTYCISAGRGQQMAIGILEELRPVLTEDMTKWIEVPDPGTTPNHWNQKPGEPKQRYVNNGERIWVIYKTYEYAETKIRRLAASGWDGKNEKAARFVNEMNVTSLEGIKEASYKI